MARLLPNRLPASAAPSVQRLFRLLKSLGDEFTIWHQTTRPGGPHFLVLWRGHHAFLLQVAATSQELATSAVQPGLLPGDDLVTPDTMGTAERETLNSFLRDPLPPDLPIRRLVVFPNVDEDTIDQIEVLRSESTGVAFLGLRQSSERRFAERLLALAEGPLPRPALYSLRKQFHPESVVQHSAARIPLSQRQQASDLPPAFLDFDQESLTKNDLDLPAEAEGVATSSEIRLVTGPAGCGKSLVLIHRAVLAARLHRGSRLLVLTHNRPINSDLRARALGTAPEGSRPLWLTFFQWASRHLDHQPVTILSARQCESRLAALLPNHPALASHSLPFLAEELGYLRDLGITSLRAYLDLTRTGRLTALSNEHRQHIWNLLEEYRHELARRNDTDWHERALAFQQLARDHPERIDPHDFIFIDEAQFFAKVWFVPVLAALAPGAQLFLAADPTQGFLRRRQSWLAAGLDVRGRAHRLSRPYRSSRAILHFATRLLAIRQDSHPQVTPDDLDPPGPADLAAIEETGEPPCLLHASSAQDALTLAARHLSALRSRAPWLAGHVLILHADSFATTDLVATLRRSLGPDAVHPLHQSGPAPPPAPYCSVSNLMAATGLEATVVYLLGLDHLLEREADPRLDPEARHELAAEHSHLLYMACTRAAKRLVIITRTPALRDLLERATQSTTT